MKKLYSMIAILTLTVPLTMPVQADPMRDLNLVNQSNAALGQNDVEAALKSASQITDPLIRAAAAGNAMLSAFSSGDLALAKQGLPMIDDVQIKDVWLGNFAGASLNAGDCKETVEMVEQIVDADLKSIWEMNIKLRCR